MCDVKVMVWKYERREKKRGAWLLWGIIEDKEESETNSRKYSYRLTQKFLFPFWWIIKLVKKNQIENITKNKKNPPRQPLGFFNFGSMYVTSGPIDGRNPLKGSSAYTLLSTAHPMGSEKAINNLFYKYWEE